MQTDLLAGWTTPFALTIGALALALCAVLAAVNLIVEAQNNNDAELVEAFRRRAMIAGAITLVLDTVAFILSPFQAPLLWHGLLDHALPRAALGHCDGAARCGSRRLVVPEALPPGACAGLYRHGVHFCFLGVVAISIPGAGCGDHHQCGQSPCHTFSVADWHTDRDGIALALALVAVPCLQGQASCIERSGERDRSSPEIKGNWKLWEHSQVTNPQPEFLLQQ